jgi:hypothetical protein
MFESSSTFYHHKNHTKMKTTLLTIVLAFSAIGLFAAGPKNKRTLPGLHRAEQTLFQEFGVKTDVSWAVAEGDLLRAQFDDEGSTVNAFINGEGELVATTRDISFFDMPRELRKAVSKKLGYVEPSGVVEFTSDSEMAYFVEATINGERRIYKGYSNGNLALYKKM